MKSKLLIVEDEVEMSHLFSLRAQHRGFQCRSDDTGAHCLEKVQKWHPDLILMDLDLPKLNGIELIIQIKARPELAHIPIIVFSSFIETELVKEALAIGANTYFVKNGNMDDLLDIIEDYTQAKPEQTELAKDTGYYWQVSH